MNRAGEGFFRNTQAAIRESVLVMLEAYNPADKYLTPLQSDPLTPVRCARADRPLDSAEAAAMKRLRLMIFPPL